MSCGPVPIVVGHGVVPRVNLALFIIDAPGGRGTPRCLFESVGLLLMSIQTITVCFATRVRGVGAWGSPFV